MLKVVIFSKLLTIAPFIYTNRTCKKSFISELLPPRGYAGRCARARAPQLSTPGIIQI